jgi:hypothetical protein
VAATVSYKRTRRQESVPRAVATRSYERTRSRESVPRAVAGRMNGLADRGVSTESGSDRGFNRMNGRADRSQYRER